MSSSNSTPRTERKPGLQPHHVAYLEKRAVPVEFAIEAGLDSLPTMTDRFAMSYRAAYRGLPLPPVSGLFVPYKVAALDGSNRARIRPDAEFYWEGEGAGEKKVPVPRWLAQAGVPVVPYFPPQITTLFKDTKVPLHIVEAPIKALSLTANGFPAIGLGGVEAGFSDREDWQKHRHLSVNKELARVDWRSREAVIVFDAGIQNNARVALGAAKLAAVLKDSGAIVRLALLPLVFMNDVSLDEAMVYEGCDQGPDDFLGRHGKDGPAKLREIIAAAIPADPVERAKAAMGIKKRAERQPAVVRLLADLTFVAGLRVGGHVVIDQVTSIVAKSGIQKRAIQEALKKLDARLSDAHREDANAIDLPYEMEKGRTTMSGPRGEPRYLADFTAKIVSEVILDDGAEKSRVFRIEGTLPNGTKLPAVDVAADAFSDMKWPTAAWGSKAIVRAGKDTKDHVRVAIQALSKPTVRNVFAHVGWREVDRRHVYLHPGGAVGADGLAVEVEVEVGRGRFALPERVENLGDAIRWSLSILDCGPLTITLPALAAAYTSILSSTLGVDFALWFVGRTGAFKSTLAALTQSHFGSFDYNSLPAGWSSTGNSLEKALFRWKDALLVVDNFVPAQTGREQQDLRGKALQLIQNIGDRSSRGRNDRNNNERPACDPRGLALFTGEDLPPTNESTLGRLVVVDVPKGALNLDKIVGVRNQIELLPSAMRGFIEHLAKDFDLRMTEAKQTRAKLASHFREALRPYGSHERTASNLATLGTGFVSFLGVAQATGVLTEVEVDTWRRRMMETFLDVGKAQRVNTEGSRPTERYVSILRDLLLQGRISLVPKEESLSANSSPTVRAVGWFDREKGEVLLVPDLAWEAVELFAGRDRWPYSQTQLQKQLAEEGLIQRSDAGDEKRRTCRRWVGGRTERVLVLAATLFDGVLPSPSRVTDADIGMVLEQQFAAN